MEEQNTESPNESIINQTFTAWALEQILHIKGAIFTVATTIGLISSFVVSFQLHELPIERHFPILYGIQTILILFILTIIAFTKPPKRYEKYKRGSEVLQQFWNWWSPLWATWLLLYAGLTFWFLTHAMRPDLNVIESDEIKFTMHQLNNLSTLVLLMLFHILSEPSVFENGKVEGDIFNETNKWNEKDKNIDNNQVEVEIGLENSRAKFIFWVTLFILTAVVEFWLIKTNSEAKTILQIFAIGYGVIAAIGIALIVGRLDSNLLGVPKWAITLLLLYVGIQPALDFVLDSSSYNGIDNEKRKIIIQVSQEVIMIIALICKILLFAVIHWLILTNRMLYFFVQAYSLMKGVNKNRSDFFQNLNSEKKPDTNQKSNTKLLESANTAKD